MQKCESLLRYLFIIHTFRPYNPRLQGLFFFIYLCVDLRHKQKHTTSSNSFHVSHLNKPMKNSTHKQKHTADQEKLHVAFTDPRRNTPQTRGSSTHLITEKLLQFYNTYFFFIYVQTTSTSTQRTRELATCFTQSFIFFYLYIDYKHRRDRSEKRGPGAFFSLHLIKCRILKRINERNTC